MVGAHRRTAVAILVERTTKFTVILGPPEGKKSAPLADNLIQHANSLPEMMQTSLTWDHGSEMAQHAALTLATETPVYFAHPRSPWEQGTNENTNGLMEWSVSTCPRAHSSPANSPTSTPSPMSSTTGHEQPSASTPHAKRSTNS